MRVSKCGIYNVAAVLVLLLIFPVGMVIAEDQSCQYCGMQRSKFGHSWVVLEHEDGSKVGLCSIHCAAIHMALNIDKPVLNITVGDYNTKKQIDADRAYWVIGGDKMGVMTKRAKWAFADQAGADAFMAAHGGSAAEFETAVRGAFEDMYADLKMIREKRKKMRTMKKK